MDGNRSSIALRNGGGRNSEAERTEPPRLRPFLQPVVDLRGAAYRLAGLSCSLDVTSITGLSSPARTARELAEAVEAATGVDVFISLEGVAGTAAATVLPAILNGAEEAGILLNRLIVDLGGPFPEPLAGDDILETIESTRGRGVRVSISRAGLSESGLEMLLGTRPDFLRVAASLVSGCGDDFYRQAIVETISGLAWKFGANVLAEGVLNERDARWLAGAGIALAYGPFFGEPLDPEAFRARLLEPSLPFDPHPVQTAGLPETNRAARRLTQEEP
jgi:EAL domain-containing protein (putative c-di-GMP-specific phosphodiesterase class I)